MEGEGRIITARFNAGGAFAFALAEGGPRKDNAGMTNTPRRLSLTDRERLHAEAGRLLARLPWLLGVSLLACAACWLWLQPWPGGAAVSTLFVSGVAGSLLLGLYWWRLQRRWRLAFNGVMMLAFLSLFWQQGVSLLEVRLNGTFFRNALFFGCFAYAGLFSGLLIRRRALRHMLASADG